MSPSATFPSFKISQVRLKIDIEILLEHKILPWNFQIKSLDLSLSHYLSKNAHSELRHSPFRAADAVHAQAGWAARAACLRDDHHPDFLRPGLYRRPCGQLSRYLRCAQV